MRSTPADLLSKDFKVGKTEVEVKSKTPSGVVRALWRARLMRPPPDLRLGAAGRARARPAQP